MERVRSGIEKIRSLTERFLEWERMVCSVLLVLMLMVTFVQVVMRFVFNSPFSWSEEVTLMLLV